MHRIHSAWISVTVNVVGYHPPQLSGCLYWLLIFIKKTVYFTKICYLNYFYFIYVSSFSISVFNNQSLGAPDAQRGYTLRKRPTSVTEIRATFVCYTCGVDTLSNQLRLVYCCPNAEREPYYPFINSLTPFPNVSPISPQGMLNYTFI